MYSVVELWLTIQKIFFSRLKMFAFSHNHCRCDINCNMASVLAVLLPKTEKQQKDNKSSDYLPSPLCLKHKDSIVSDLCMSTTLAGYFWHRKMLDTMLQLLYLVCVFLWTGTFRPHQVLWHCDLDLVTPDYLTQDQSVQEKRSKLLHFLLFNCFSLPGMCSRKMFNY